MSIHESRALVQLGRGGGWGLTRDAARLHLATRLRTAIGGGLSPVEALRAIAGEPRGLRPRGGGLWISLDAAVAAAGDGAPLSEALAASRAVDDWDRRLLETAERAGRLEEALEAWIEGLRVRACGLRVIPSVLAYPFMLAVIATAAVVILSTQVLPTLAAILTGAGVPWDPLAQWAVRSADWSSTLLSLVIAALTLLGVLMLLARSLPGPLGLLLDRWLFLLPALGSARRVLTRSTGLAAAAAALDAGDSDVEALRVASQVQSSAGSREAWARVSAEAAGGGSLQGAGLLGRRFLRSLESALATEDSADRLRRLAQREMAAWWRRAETTVAWVEPLLILGLGAFLGTQLVGWWLMIYTTGAAVMP